MSEQLKTQSQYVAELRKHLPKEAFKPAGYKVLFRFLHVALIFFFYYLFLQTNSYGAYILFPLIIGHSLACLGFLAHELSHNAIIRTNLKYPLETFLWGLNLIPASMWRRLHNETHHHHTNTPQDPDRQFLEREKGMATKWYTQLFYPNKSSLKWNFLVGFHFVPYILKNISAVFFSKGKPSIVPRKPNYSSNDVWKVCLELLFIIGFQIILYLFFGDLVKYLFAAIIPVFIASSILMVYIFTNHFLNPICEVSDPLVTTTSVKVPKLFDKLHHNFSYHTEHHLFPSINSDYYPQVSELLKEKYAASYNYIPIGQAWKRLWDNSLYIKDEDIRQK